MDVAYSMVKLWWRIAAAFSKSMMRWLSEYELLFPFLENSTNVTWHYKCFMEMEKINEKGVATATAWLWRIIAINIIFHTYFQDILEKDFAMFECVSQAFSNITIGLLGAKCMGFHYCFANWLYRLATTHFIFIILLHPLPSPALAVNGDDEVFCCRVA